MSSDVDLTSYRDFLAEALDAYRTDSSYAEDMAKQAVALRLRQGSREPSTSRILVPA